MKHGSTMVSYLVQIGLFMATHFNLASGNIVLVAHIQQKTISIYHLPV